MEKPKEPTVTELKAMAYDTMAQIESLNRRMAQINQAIVAKSQEKPKEESDEKPG